MSRYNTTRTLPRCWAPHTQAQVYGVLAMMQRRNAPVNYLYFMQACDENDMAVLDLYGLS